MKKIYKYSFLLLLTLIVSCSNEEGFADINLDKSEVSAMSGEWFVKLLVDGEDIYDIGYYKISTHNTPQGGAQIYLDDFKTWPLKTIVPVDINNLTFSGSDLLDEYTKTTTVDITDGKITKNGTTSSDGTVTDKISFTIEFSDDPGTVYTIEGYKRTGFLEDEH
ncbi:MAG TPA: lipid-binding protein [Mariniflexile sp.]|nr:lipid-binding protein [Mariniflexile sp.]